MEEKTYSRTNVELPDLTRQKHKALIYAEFFFIANSCGFFSKPAPSFRPHVEMDYYLIYLTENYLSVTVDEKKTYLQAGDLLIIPPSARYELQATVKEGNLSFYWLHYTGSQVEMLMENCDLYPNIVYRITQNEAFTAHFHRLFSLFEGFLQDRDTVLLDTLAPVHFLNMLADLRRSSHVTDPLYVHHDSIQHALRYMRRNFCEPISIEALAAMHNLSPSYFRTIFKKHTGSSPIDYVIDLRVNYAAQLLLGSNLSVQEISEMTGFQSQAYFSRIFKRKLGLTPTEYRKIGFANRKDPPNTAPI